MGSTTPAAAAARVAAATMTTEPRETAPAAATPHASPSLRRLALWVHVTHRDREAESTERSHVLGRAFVCGADTTKSSRHAIDTQHKAKAATRFSARNCRLYCPAPRLSPFAPRRLGALQRTHASPLASCIKVLCAHISHA